MTWVAVKDWFITIRMKKEDIKLIPELDTADMMREGKGQYNLLIRCICLQWISCSDGRLPKPLKSISQPHKSPSMRGELSISLQILELIMKTVFLSSLISHWSRLGVSLGRKAFLPPWNSLGLPLVLYLPLALPFKEPQIQTKCFLPPSFFLWLCSSSWNVEEMFCYQDWKLVNAEGRADMGGSP